MNATTQPAPPTLDYIEYLKKVGYQEPFLSSLDVAELRRLALGELDKQTRRVKIRPASFFVV
jgi:hypothetical protein